MCHGVMYKQLSAWLLHGLLLDYYDEFFIMKSSSVNPTYSSAEEIETDDQKISHDVCKYFIKCFVNITLSTGVFLYHMC